MTTDTEPLAYSRQEAADACGVGLRTIERALASGALKAKRSATNKDKDPAGRYLILRHHLLEWLEGLPDA